MLRTAIASSLLELWQPVVAKYGDRKVPLLRQFCYLVIQLLQDPEPDVRAKMANSVAKLLQGVLCVCVCV